mmetsp:Transcript_4467/g.12433  ORF Transcript_4467/g.12433 Transcript_4467/m.12433 type:complete len:202 (-) Transcript_4467:954-1559(-)
MKRKIIFHGGPTNSGKTYSALQCLRQAKRGMYYGPLRLLAAEVFDELNLAGIACNLYTGQEKKYVRNATHGAATVEMAQSRVGMEGPQKPLDVVVIDEVQMLGDPDRGASWTRALLGLDCPEIHVCGGMEAAALVGSIAESCGDDFEMRTYERFLPLLHHQQYEFPQSLQLQPSQGQGSPTSSAVTAHRFCCVSQRLVSRY